MPCRSWFCVVSVLVLPILFPPICVSFQLQRYFFSNLTTLLSVLFSQLQLSLFVIQIYVPRLTLSWQLCLIYTCRLLPISWSCAGVRNMCFTSSRTLLLLVLSSSILRLAPSVSFNCLFWCCAFRASFTNCNHHFLSPHICSLGIYCLT